MKIGEEIMGIWMFNFLLNFNICWPIFTISCFTPLFPPYNARLTPDAFDKLIKETKSFYTPFILFFWL